MAAGFEHPKNIDQIRGEVGKDKGQTVVKHGIPSADGVGDLRWTQAEQLNHRIMLAQGWEYDQRTRVENNNVDARRNSTGDGILNELDQRRVLATCELPD